MADEREAAVAGPSLIFCAKTELSVIISTYLQAK